MTALGTALGASATSAYAVGTAVALVGASGAMSAYGSYQQGQTAAKVARNNQIMGEYAAQDAVKRGDEDAARVRRTGDQIKGAQRSSMAARGLDLGVGTAQELQDQTDFFSLTDQNTARDSAKRDAWASRAQGANIRAQGDAARQQGNLAAFSTLLGTAGQVSGKWASYGKGP